MRYLAILGQNRELSLAELEAVYPGIKNISRQNESVIFDSEEKIDIDRLGGTPKLAEILAENIIFQDAKDAILEELKKLNKEQKIFFGLSFYENRDRKKYDRLGNRLKRRRIQSALGCVKRNCIIQRLHKNKQTFDARI